MSLFFTVVAMSGAAAHGVRVPPQGTIKLSPEHPAAGQEVTVTWTLENPTGPSVTGKVVYYLGSYPLNAVSANVPLTLPKNGKKTDSFTFLPYPGWNQISVVLLNTQIALPSGRPPILEPIDPSQPLRPKPSAGSGVTRILPSEIFLVTATYGFDDTASISGGQQSLEATVRQQLLAEYSPLLLYSYDHGSEEKYPPIDAIPFVQGSSLGSGITGVENIPNSTLQSARAAFDILNPPGNPPNAGTITTTATQEKLFLEPNTATQQGTPWTSAKPGVNAQGKNIGLYGRVILLDLSNLSLTDPALPAASLQERYHCSPGDTTCAARVVKLEYWQLYGYSADFYGNTVAEDLASHQGDWCCVHVFIDLNWASSSRPDRAILWVIHYLHGKQVGFNLALDGLTETPVTVPARGKGEAGPTYSAQELHGPNYGDSVNIPASFPHGILVPPGETNNEQQLFRAYNNVLRLATEGPIEEGPARVSPGGHVTAPRVNASYRHPVVYVEWGGHEFWPTDDWTYKFASKHNGTGKYSYFGDSPTDITSTANNTNPPTIPSEADVALVLLFSGFWGAPALNGPPQGPGLHCQFYWDPATNATLFGAVHSGESIDSVGFKAGQLGGKCGGGRTF